MVLSLYSQRKIEGSMTIADKILDWMRRKPGREYTADELGALVFGYSSPKLLYRPLRELVDQGRLVRVDVGGWGAEFRYRLPPITRRL